MLEKIYLRVCGKTEILQTNAFVILLFLGTSLRVTVASYPFSVGSPDLKALFGVLRPVTGSHDISKN